jgi:hypothetical protein
MLVQPNAGSYFHLFTAVTAASTRGELPPSANVGWVDGLDSAEPEKQSATSAQQETADENDESLK